MKKTAVVTSASVLIITLLLAFTQDKPRYKNLKILPKNTDKYQMDSVMKGFSASLGVKCNFCHYFDTTQKSMDFASDKIDHKGIARQMMTMTNKLNKKYFDVKDSKSLTAKLEVTCYSCHNGRVHPARFAGTGMQQNRGEKEDQQIQQEQNNNIMEPQYDFGMIGLGVMGSNLLLNMADHGFAAIGFDLKPERGTALEAAANKGTVVKGVSTLGEMVLSLKKPRKIMMLVPAGKPVDNVISSLLPYVEDGDIVIDGGNSFFEDTLHRIQYLQDKGIHFFGMGVSGGEMGARVGPSMMPGGDKEAYEYLRPILEAIAAKADGEPCVAFMGDGAAGHFVKMVHNGIEYALMQMISEAYDLLHRGAGFDNTQLHHTFKSWNEGQLQSYLIKITAEVFKTGDNDTPGNEDYLVDNISDKAGSKGTGKWTSQEAMNLPVSIPTIDMAVAMRDLSVYKDERVEAAKLYKPEIQPIGAPEALVKDLENALAFCYVIAYAQGLNMLAVASKQLNLNTSIADVIKVWRAGCIIRSAMLGDFYKAYQKTPELNNLLLDANIATMLKKGYQSLKNVIIQATTSGIPAAGMMSALAYFEAYRSERLPTNLIQAQRDYFGAHTYQRTDKEGVFHTEWHSEDQ